MDPKEAYRKASLMCSRKEYCISDLKKKMINWILSPEQKEDIISKLLQENYIDESRFVQAFVKDKFRFNKWGKIKIVYHLKQKQISSENIAKAIENIPEEDYKRLINELLVSKNRNLKAKDGYERKAKLLRFMTQRGFEFELVNNGIEDLLQKN